MRIRMKLIFVAGIMLAVNGCGGGGGETCNLDTHDGCADGLVCEQVSSGEPACFQPVYVDGRVFDLNDEAGIEDATIVGLDANGSAQSSVARSDVDGNYSLRVPITRTSEGAPADEAITLRVAAQGYQGFPTAPRVALPIDLSQATQEDAESPYRIANATTDVALLALESVADLGTIVGSITGEDGRGALIVAVIGDTAVSTAIADVEGAFIVFNVPAGTVNLEGYRQGLTVEPENVDVTAGDSVEQDLVAMAEELAAVSGSVNIVNAPGGSETSVLLVLESTFDEELKRGEAPAGLRAGNVSGAFRIEDVPPGKYVVLAAFENDDLVRDPDEAIGGTQIVHITVNGSDVDTDASFKVTEALAVVTPGAEGISVIETLTPTLTWADDSSEDGYELRIFDAFGTLVHEILDLPKVSGSGDVDYDVPGGILEEGMIYQFQVKSWRDSSGDRTYISATEDLRGVFEVQP